MTRSSCLAPVLAAIVPAVGFSQAGCSSHKASDQEHMQELECPGDCTNQNLVPSGTFFRDNDERYPANVHAFWLDTNEVTVREFRAFVADFDSWRASGKPASGDGLNSHVLESGWQTAWPLPTSSAELLENVNCKSIARTWTDEPGPNEDLPINCVSWYEAFAYCTWLNKRLPTELEWNYGAAGGDEQRLYPWGNAEPGQNVDLAIYGCHLDPGNRCDVRDIAPVGSVPAGKGRWGHLDLAGNAWEWTLDAFAPYPSQCDHCFTLVGSRNRVARGGSFYNVKVILQTSHRMDSAPLTRSEDFGIRCAQ